MKKQNELEKKLIEFINLSPSHKNYNVKIISTSMEEIRNVYKGWSSEYGDLRGKIFNSSWNRQPNLELNSIRREKLGYIIRIGIGIASPNLIPITLLTGKLSIINFLLKDRGHLLEAACNKYREKIWSLNDFKIVLDIERIKLSDGYIYNNSEQIKSALEIIYKFDVYLDKIFKLNKKKGIKSKDDMFISLENLADAVKEFEYMFNDREIAVEVSREDIWIHLNEILKINNVENKWLEEQKALLSFWGYTYNTDGDTKFVDNILSYNTLSSGCKLNEFWSGNLNTKYKLLSTTLKTYNDILGPDGAIPLPMFLVGISLSNTPFEENSALFETRGERDFLDIYKNIYKSNLSEDKFHKSINLYEKIAKYDYWNEFNTKITKLYIKWKDTDRDAGNIKHSNIKHYSYGGACILACSNIINKKCKKRTSESQIREVVLNFTTKLYDRVEKLANDKTYFAVGKSSTNRIKMTVMEVYKSIIEIDSNGVLTDMEARKLHFDELVDVCGKNINREFKVINLTKKASSKLDITTIDFREIVSNPTKSNIDLGHRKATGKVTLENTILQQRGNNRSYNDEDHLATNSEYWKWFSKENLRLVNYYTTRLLELKEYDVLADAVTLVAIFRNNDKKEVA